MIVFVADSSVSRMTLDCLYSRHQQNATCKRERPTALLRKRILAVGLPASEPSFSLPPLLLSPPCEYRPVIFPSHPCIPLPLGRRKCRLPKLFSACSLYTRSGDPPYHALPVLEERRTRLHQMNGPTSRLLPICAQTTVVSGGEYCQNGFRTSTTDSASSLSVKAE